MAVNLPTLQRNGVTCGRCQHAEPTCNRTCRCTISGRQLLEHQASGECPLNLFPPPVEGPAFPEQQPQAATGESPCAQPERWGPHYWNALHTAARAGKLTAEWLSRWLKAIPCPDCRQKAQAAVDADPLDAEPLAWSWRFHNAINTELGKPTMPLESFTARWVASAPPVPNTPPQTAPTARTQ